jgi:hypothetical protein
VVKTSGCHSNVEVKLVPGGKFRFRDEERLPLRLPDEILKCAAFIGEDVGDGTGDLHGTGFFVSVPFGFKLFYLVTARHLANDLLGREIYITVNKCGGGVIALRPYSPWWFHPTDKTADIAVLPCILTQEIDFLAIPIEDFVTPEMLTTKKIGIGDEVLSTGLFTPAPGESRNMPIVRHGNLAMLPDQPIQTEMGFADVYLIEARSIGGLSGSPVFIRETLYLPIELPGGVQTALRGLGRLSLLGVMQGHWDIKESNLNKINVSHDAKRGVNLGISIVVPAFKIIETINQEGLQAMRMEMDARKDLIPGMDSARPITNE